MPLEQLLVPGTEFLRDGGHVARRVAMHDWSAHPLGPPQSWPTELKTSLSMMLGSRFAMCLGWGPDLLLFYNDAYVPVLGVKEPTALGWPLREVWHELWDDVRGMAEMAMSGTATWVEDMYLRMERNGVPEDTWWTFTYSPVRQADGRVVAMLCITHETTRRVLTQRRLADERARLARMFDQAPAFMAMLRGPEHRFEFANAAYLRLVGRDDLVGRTVAEALPEVVRQGWMPVLDEVYRSGRPHAEQDARFVAEPEHGAPQEHYLDFVFQPFTDQDGSIGGLVLVGMDNTRRTRTEQALRRREAELEQLNRELEQRVAEHAHERSLNWQVTPDMLGVFDRDGILERSNPAWQQVLGWSHEELAARPMRELLHPGDRGAAAAARQRLHAGEPLLGFECRMRARDGSYRTLSWVATPQGGKFYCSARDVTAHRAAVAALAESQAQLRNLFETSFQLQGMCALDGTLLDANQTALAMIGASREDVVGRTFWDTPWFAGTPGMPERIRAGVLRAAAGEPVHDELELVLPDGRRVLELSLRPFRGADGRITAVVQEAIDITERRIAEEALRQSQKLEAMGQLTGGVAHDFNNLLAPIMAALELAADPAANPERRARTIAVARQSTERAAMLVQRLLAFARKQPLQTVVVDVCALLEGIGALMRSSFDPRVRIQVRAGADTPPARADWNQLEMALLNLGVNARDAMPEGGTLTLSARSAEVPGPGAPRALPAGRYAVITVADTGAGMDEATRARAIEPFFSTKGVGKGTGLGLSMAHGLALQLGGCLHIDSAPGEGTMVELWLPSAGEP